MAGLVVTLHDLDAEAFAPYGRFVMPPDEPGTRQFFSDALDTRSETSTPVLHVNHVLPQTLPITAKQIERHPYAAQCFFPLDVSRYVVMVTPSDANGSPVLDQALAFLMPATAGVIYNPGVWHLGATVLDRVGHFAVLMWRSGQLQDDDFQSIPAMTIVAPT